jgi:hypothetical protein
MAHSANQSEVAEGRFGQADARRLAAVTLAVFLATGLSAGAFHEDPPRCGSSSRYAFIENPEEGYVEVYFPGVPGPPLPFPLSGGGIGTWLDVPGAWLLEMDPSQPPYLLYDVAVCHVSNVKATLTFVSPNAPAQEQRFGARGSCSGRDSLGGIFDVPIGVSVAELRIAAQPCRPGRPKPLVDAVTIHVVSLQAGSEAFNAA